MDYNCAVRRYNSGTLRVRGRGAHFFVVGFVPQSGKEDWIRTGIEKKGVLSMLIWKKGVLRIVVCLIAAVLLLVGNADAATFRVTTNADSGAGSLRQAVLDANATVELDEIQIDAGVGVIALASEVNISSPLKISGGGVTVKGSATRLFSVTGGTVGFDRITFTGGKSFSGNGGAVNIEGAAKADFVNCTFFDNDAALKGGAVCVASTQPDATTFLNCTVAGNSAENGGGVATVRGITVFSGTIVVGNIERGALPKGADVYAEASGTVSNTGSYNVVGHTNMPGSFGAAQGNHASVSSADVFGKRPLALTAVDKVQVLKLSSLSGNVARDLIPMDSVLKFPKEDERGARRPQLLGLDAGALELSPVPVASVDLKGSSYIQLGTTERYTVAVHPDDATRDIGTYKDGIEWSVSDAGVISVDASGGVTALRTGNAVLFARVHGWDAAGNTTVSPMVSLKIRVGTTPLPAPKVKLEALGDRSMTLGTTQRLQPTVRVTLLDEPSDIPYSLSAFSSSPAVADAEVLPDGKSILLTAKALGKCPITVTATAENGAGPASDSQTFILTVSDKSSGKGGGGCDAGWSGLTLALAALFLLRRKA